MIHSMKFFYTWNNWQQRMTWYEDRPNIGWQYTGITPDIAWLYVIWLYVNRI